MKKIVTIVGARPQFIKAAAVSREIAHHQDIREIIVHTGQHFDANMSDVFFEEMHIPKPDYNLDVNGLGHGAMTGQMMEKIEQVLLEEKPDWVLVYGDTNSTIAGALAARKLHIKVAHVEAGLRSFNMRMPEEINRILTDRISNILFCPTDEAISNLQKEGYDNLDIEMVKSGDVMQDAAMFYAQSSRSPGDMIPEKYILTTVHRAENTDDPQRLKAIFDALVDISNEIPVVLPLHPRTQKIAQKLDLDMKRGKLIIIDPVGYLEMVYLLQHAHLVMTDSGGLQKEAFFFHKPCITLRDETEWVELVHNNYNTIVGASKEKIVTAFRQQNYDLDYSKDLYGQGKASATIIEALKNYKN
jgi:UDP-GlcNAc3NAcA epimerase